MSKTLKPPGDSLGGFLKPFNITLPTDVLVTALTHRSWAAEHPGSAHNERLEFLGDAVLGQSVAMRLFNEFPELPEGELSRRRAALVSAHTLAEIARVIGLGLHIKLGRGEKRSGGSNKESILADTLEAIIGAVFITHGFDLANKFVRDLTAEHFLRLDELTLFFDPKTTVQEEADARGIPRPSYEVEGTGPNHDRIYTARVELQGFTGQGSASNKKAAEVEAAKEIVNRLLEAGELITVKQSKK